MERCVNHLTRVCAFCALLRKLVASVYKNQRVSPRVLVYELLYNSLSL